MAEFNLNFLDLSTQSQLDLNIYEPYFLNYKYQDWQKGSCGGGFKYMDCNGASFTLVISTYKELGIAFLYSSRGAPASTSLVSLSKQSAMNRFIEVNDCFYMPEGSFLSPSQAWAVVQEFFKIPNAPPEAVRWIASDSLDWPLK